ncbi:hypothetical protein [Nocardia sp. NRRL S-836]|uniref:hypothetical protein n=1 Tax=Nocardia sp. NRRL S-836 TaxID=1519492 RepID=UPI0012FA0E6D|nr:hypothetical protein [Nocardia sp. NRRL S-836]
MNLSPSRSRTLLVLILVGSLAANVAAQAFGLGLFLSVPFGLLAIAGGVALFSDYRNNRDHPRN